MRHFALAVAAAAAASTSAHGAVSGCGVAAARAAIAATHPRIQLLGPDATRVQPGSADRVICFDFTRDGRLDLAVTIASGGTAGDIGLVVFRRTASGWHVALAAGGYKLGIARVHGDLVVSQPVYRKRDPNCCPTGGFDRTRYHWNGRRFVVARTWHVKRL